MFGTSAHAIARPVLRTWLASHGAKLRQTSPRRFATKCVMNHLIYNAPERGELSRSSDYSELKRRLKAEQKAKEKAGKEEARMLTVAQSKSEKKDIFKEEEISPNVNFRVLSNRNLCGVKFILGWTYLEENLREKALSFHGEGLKIFWIFLMIQQLSFWYHILNISNSWSLV